MWSGKCERREIDRSKECPLRRPLSPLTGVNGRTGHNKPITTHIPTLHMHRNQTQNAAVSPFSFAIVKIAQLCKAKICWYHPPFHINVDIRSVSDYRKVVVFSKEWAETLSITISISVPLPLSLCITANTKLHVPPTY